MVLKNNQPHRRRALFGLFAGFSLSAAAEAQTVGVPETPANPQLPSDVPASVAPTPPIVGGVPEGDFFTLDDPLKPLGETLASKGIYLKGFWGSTLYANVSGGTQRTKIVYNEAFYGVLPHFPCSACGIMRLGERGRGEVRCQRGRTSSASAS
jgi:porin